jgi:hypothetical protein
LQNASICASGSVLAPAPVYSAGEIASFSLQVTEIFDGSKKVGENILQRPRAFDFEVAVDEPDRHPETTA